MTFGFFLLILEVSCQGEDKLIQKDNVLYSFKKELPPSWHMNVINHNLEEFNNRLIDKDT